MNRTRKTALVIAFTVVLLAAHYRFGFPLRNIIDHSACMNAFQATLALPQHEVYRQTERSLSGRPKINCASALVIDNNTQEILFAKNSSEKRSIASISKLMSALVLEDMRFDWTKPVHVVNEDAENSSRSRLKVGESFSANDLLFVALVCSDNRAVRALARATGLANGDFIEMMNNKARSLGMYSSEFHEVSGLDSMNMATAEDCARLLNAALNDRLIAAATTTEAYAFRPLNKVRMRNIVNTNRLLNSDWTVKGGKTGYIRRSGYCLATRLEDGMGHDITVVVLGAPGSNSRFKSVQSLASWAFDNLTRIDRRVEHASQGLSSTGSN
jgi:D-alanyl-D-alanine endopeptidase (penicillin-binding protein 7)